MSENVQDIKEIHKLNHKSYENSESETNSKMTKPSRSKNPKWYLPGRLTLATTMMWKILTWSQELWKPDEWN